MDEPRQRRWLEEWGGLWGLPGLDRRLRLVFSPRIRRSLGLCRPERGELRLHPALRDAPTGLLREVVCHEAAHAAVHLLHGRKPRPHGREWQDLMRAAGFEPRVRFPPSALPEEVLEATRPRHAWLHVCSGCGARWTAGRRDRRWRCQRCVEAGRPGRLRATRVTSPR